jgi:hypothetical protein
MWVGFVVLRQEADIMAAREEQINASQLSVTVAIMLSFLR